MGKPSSASQPSTSPLHFQRGDKGPRYLLDSFYAKLFARIQFPTSKWDLIFHLSSQWVAEEQTGQAGLGDGVLLSCSTSPALATTGRNLLQDRDEQSQRLTLHLLWMSLHLPGCSPKPVGAGAIKHPKPARRKNSFCPKLHILLSPQPRLVLIPRPTSPQAGGKPDSLAITVISHPYMWLQSVEKETALIFQ